MELDGGEEQAAAGGYCFAPPPPALDLMRGRRRSVAGLRAALDEAHLRGLQNWNSLREAGGHCRHLLSEDAVLQRRLDECHRELSACGGEHGIAWSKASALLVEELATRTQSLELRPGICLGASMRQGCPPEKDCSVPACTNSLQEHPCQGPVREHATGLSEIVLQGHNALCTLEGQLRAERSRNMLLRSELQDERACRMESATQHQEAIEGLRSELAKLRYGTLQEADLLGIERRLAARASVLSCKRLRGSGAEAAIPMLECELAVCKSPRRQSPSSAASECWDGLSSCGADADSAVGGPAAPPRRLSLQRRHRRARSTHLYHRTHALAAARRPRSSGANPSWRATLGCSTGLC